MPGKWALLPLRQPSRRQLSLQPVNEIIQILIAVPHIPLFI